MGVEWVSASALGLTFQMHIFNLRCYLAVFSQIALCGICCGLSRPYCLICKKSVAKPLKHLHLSPALSV